MRLANRIFWSFFGIIVGSAVASAVTGAILISRAVQSEASTRVEAALREADANLAIREQLLAVALRGGADAPLPLSFQLRWAGRVPAALLDAGLPASGPSTGFLAVRRADLVALGVEVPAALPAGPADTMLCLYAAQAGGGGGAMVGELLNGNEELVSGLQDRLFGRELYGAKPFGTVTVFCGDTRIATTVLGPGGEIAVGTRVSEAVRESVLGRGERWLGRALVVDAWYLSAYEPIRNPAGAAAGILYVGVLERRYLDLRNRTLVALLWVSVPALAGLLAGAFAVARGIARPLGLLAGASSRVAGGDFAVRLSLGRTASEVAAVARAFDAMTGALREREERLREDEQLLRRQNAELEQANRDYQDLLSFVTHEMSNSVGSLMFNVAALADEASGPLAAEQREIVDQLLRDTTRFGDMVRNYLSLSRIEHGSLPFQPAAVEVKPRVIEPVLRRLSTLVTHHGMEVRWAWPTGAATGIDPVTVRADPELLEICYSNLVINALKYGEGWLEFSAEREGDAWRLGVGNGGAPIPAEQVALLFRKFSRLVQGGVGAGLGLYLVRTIVERHGGEVSCRSGPEGTTFTIRLPCP